MAKIDANHPLRPTIPDTALNKNAPIEARENRNQGVFHNFVNNLLPLLKSVRHISTM